MIPNIGNVLTRLGGLKNVHGRRVMPGDNYLEELEGPDESFSQPFDEEEPGMLENLTPQQPQMLGNQAGMGSDVRANQQLSPTEKTYGMLEEGLKQFLPKGQAPGGEIPPSPQQLPQEEEGPGFWSKLGSGLKNALLTGGPQEEPPVTPQAPPVETAQVEASEGLSPTTASQEEAAGQVPEGGEAQKEPELSAVPGATQEAYSNPDVKKEVERIFGAPIDENMIKELKDWEDVLSQYKQETAGLRTDLNERQRTIKDRIDSRNLSPQDQLLMALALIAPTMLAGATLGKEAAFGVLGGSAGAIGGLLKGQEKETRADEETLNQMNRDLSKLAKEEFGAERDIGQVKQKAIAATKNKDLQDLFLKDGEVIDGKLVLNTGNPLVPLNAEKIRSPEDVKQFKTKKLPYFEKKIGSMKDAVSISDKMYDILDKAEKEEKSGISGFIKEKTGPLGWAYGLGAKAAKAAVPGLRDTFKDEFGKDVKFDAAYRSAREGLLDMYRSVMKGLAAKHTETHLFREIPNPFEAGEFLHGEANIGQAKSQLRGFVTRIEEALIHEMESSGVDTRRAKEYFKDTKMKEAGSEFHKKAKIGEELSDIATGKK